MQKRVEIGALPQKRITENGVHKHRLAGARAFISQHPGVLVSLALLMVLTLIIFPLAPHVAPYNPIEIFRKDRFHAPSGQYLLGTDELGRDLLSRVIYGGRVSLAVGVVSALIATLIGVPFGLWGGYALGVVDSIIMRVADTLLAFPAVLLAMVMVGFLGPSPRNVIIALVVVNIPRFARVARASMLSQRSLPYVESAVAIGAPQHHILIRTILPNTFGPLLVLVAIATADAILLEAGLSFLGLGIQPPDPSWGLMIGTAKRYLSQAPWYGFGPGFMLILIVLILNGLADGLQKLLDPRR